MELLGPNRAICSGRYSSIRLKDWSGVRPSCCCLSTVVLWERRLKANDEIVSILICWSEGVPKGDVHRAFPKPLQSTHSSHSLCADLVRFRAREKRMLWVPKRLGAASILIVLLSLASPIAAARQSATGPDCSRATTRAGRAICTTPELRAADAAMAIG